MWQVIKGFIDWLISLVCKTPSVAPAAVPVELEPPPIIAAEETISMPKAKKLAPPSAVKKKKSKVKRKAKSGR